MIIQKPVRKLNKMFDGGLSKKYLKYLGTLPKCVLELEVKIQRRARGML